MLNNIFKYEIIFLFKNYCPTPCVNCPRFVSNCLSNNECSEIFLIILFKNIFEKYFSKIFFDLKSLICGFSKTAIFLKKIIFQKTFTKNWNQKSIREILYYINFNHLHMRESLSACFCEHATSFDTSRWHAWAVFREETIIFN